MLVDPKDLQGATAFWKNEDEITRKAKQYVIGLKKRQCYDFHDIRPEAYDLKAGKGAGDLGKPGGKSKGIKKADTGGGGGDGGEDAPAPEAPKAIPGFENDDTAALLKAKASGLAVNKQSALATAMEHI